MKKELRERLRDLREDNDLKQSVIANYLGIAQQTYSNYENGYRDIPVSVVVKLAKYYQVSTDYLLSSDSSYLGNIDMNAPYTGNITLHDMVYKMQELNSKSRRDLVQYIRFLLYRDKSEPKDS